MTPKRRHDIIQQAVDDELLILDRGGEQIHQLNTSAVFIWQACDGLQSVEQIAVQFAQVFDLSWEQALGDVRRTVADLYQRRLLVGPEEAESNNDSTT